MPLSDRYYRESKEEWEKRIWRKSDRHRVKEDRVDDIRDMKDEDDIFQ